MESKAGTALQNFATIVVRLRHIILQKSHRKLLALKQKMNVILKINEHNLFQTRFKIKLTLREH